MSLTKHNTGGKKKKNQSRTEIIREMSSRDQSPKRKFSIKNKFPRLNRSIKTSKKACKIFTINHTDVKAKKIQISTRHCRSIMRVK